MRKNSYVKSIEFISPLGQYMQEYIKKYNSVAAYNTMKNLCMCLKIFDRYLKSIEYTCVNVTREIYDSWVSSLQPRKKSTIYMYCSIVARFLSFLSSMGVETYVPDKLVKSDDYVPHIFTNEERRLIFAAADNYTSAKSKKPYIQVVLPMALRIIDSCGCREAETLLLKVKDIDFNMGCITIRKSKAGKERFIPLDSKLNEMIKSYCTSMGIISNPDAYLFPGNTANEPMDARSFLHHYHRILTNAGVIIFGKGKGEHQGCIHDFRHTFACRSLESLVDKGFDEDDVFPYLSTYLGHEDLYGTDRYLQYPTERMDKDVNKFESYNDSLYQNVPIFREDISSWVK